jgi:NAD(P)-dependent dehydrogenase (short-subunit alcohol dehydrogenase family)
MMVYLEFGTRRTARLYGLPHTTGRKETKMKYAIVTGGARGLGLGIVHALLADKVVDRVAVIDRALVPAPPEIADRIEGFNGDVTDEA